MSNILPNSGWETKPTKVSTVFGITYNCQKCNSSVCNILKTMQDEENQDHRSNVSILDLVILEDKLITENLELDMSNINVDIRSRQVVAIAVTQSLQNYSRQEDYEAIFDGIIQSGCLFSGLF